MIYLNNFNSLLLLKGGKEHENIKIIYDLKLRKPKRLDVSDAYWIAQYLNHAKTELWLG